MHEKFIADQLTGYCKSIGCKGLCGTFQQTDRGVYITVHSSTPPPRNRFTLVRDNSNGAYKCFISEADYYNNDITGGLEPFVKQVQDTQDYY